MFFNIVGSSAQLSTRSSVPSNGFNPVPEYSRTLEVAPSSGEYTQEISVQRNGDVNQMEEVISHISPGSSSSQHSSSHHSSSIRTLCTEENVNTVEHSDVTMPSSEREISLKSSSDKLSQIGTEGVNACCTQDNRKTRGDDTRVEGNTDDTIDDEIIFDSLDVTFVKPDLPKFVASTRINSASTMESLQNKEERNCADRLEDCSNDCTREDRAVDRAGEERAVDRAGEDRVVDRAGDRMEFNEVNEIVESIEEEKRSCEVGMVSDEARSNTGVSIPQLTRTDQNRNEDFTEENRTDDRDYQGDSIRDDEDDRVDSIRAFEQQTYPTNVGQTVLNCLHTDGSRDIVEEDRGDDDSVEETSMNEDEENVRQSQADQSLTDSPHQGKWEDSSESDETSGLELTDHTRDAGDGKSDNYEEDESEGGGAVGDGDGHRDLCDEVEIRRERRIDSEMRASMSENVKSGIGGDAGYAAVRCDSKVRCDSEVRCDSKVRNFDQEEDAIKVTSEDESEMGVRDVSTAPPHVSKESEVINRVGDKSSDPSVAATIENNGQKELISESAKSKLMSILTSKISKISSEATPKSTTYSKESTENMSNPQSNVTGSSRNNSSDSRWNKSSAGISNQNSSNDSKNKIIQQKTDINAGICSNDPSDCVGSAHFSSGLAGCTTPSDGLAHSDNIAPHGNNIPSNEDIQMESVISTDNGSDYNYFYGYDVKKEAKSNVPNHPIKSDLEVVGQKNKNPVDIPQSSNCDENVRKDVEVKKIPKKEQERAPETKPKPNFFGPKPWVARYKQTDSSMSANRTSTLARLFSKESSPPESPDTKTLNSTDDIEKLKQNVNVKDSSGYVRAETLPRNIFQTRDSCTSPEKDAPSNECASSTEISQSIPRIEPLKGSSPTGSFQISSLPGPSQDEKRTPSLPFVDLQQNLSNWHQQTRKKEAATANKIFSSNKQNKTENAQLPQEQKSRGVATEPDGTLKKKSFWRKSEMTKEQEVTKEPPLKVELNQPTIRSSPKPIQSPDVAVVSLEQLMAGKASLRKTSSTDESIVMMSSDRSFVIRSSALPPGKSILESSLPSAPSLLRSPVKKSSSGTLSPRTPTETEDVREQLMLAIQNAKGKPVQQVSSSRFECMLSIIDQGLKILFVYLIRHDMPRVSQSKCNLLAQHAG